MRIRSNETQPYESQVLPSEEIPIVKSLSEERSKEIPQVPANPIWNALGKSSDIVYDVAINMLEVERQEQFQAAQVDMSKNLTQARLDIINDPKYLQSTAGELTSVWRTKSDSIRENSLGSVKHKQSKADLLKSWQASDNDSMVFFTSHGWTNTLARAKDQRAKASIQATMDVVNNDKPNAEPFLRIKKMYDDAVTARTITREEADVELQAWSNNTTREYLQRQFITQIQNSPNFNNNAKNLTKMIEEETVLNANDKTVLLHQVEQFRHSAEVKAKEDSEVGEEKVAYAAVYSRFKGDNEGAAKFLRNPSNYPDMKPSVRNRLAATFEHMDYVGKQALKEEQDKTMNDFLPRIYGPDKTLTVEDVYGSNLEPNQKEHFLKLIQQPTNKKEYTTRWDNYNARASEAYSGKITNLDEIFSDDEKYEGISIKDREHLWHVAKAMETPEKRLIKQSMDELDRYITSTTVIKNMPPKAPAKGATEEQKRMYNEEMRNFTYNISIEGRKAKAHAGLETALEKGKKEGKSITEMLDRTNKDNVLDPILKSSMMSLSEQQEANKKFLAETKEKMNNVTPATPDKPVNKSELKMNGATNDEISWATKFLKDNNKSVNNKNIEELIKQKRNKSIPPEPKKKEIVIEPMTEKEKETAKELEKIQKKRNTGSPIERSFGLYNK